MTVERAAERKVNLGGAVIGITAARSAVAQAEQVRRCGGVPVVAPTLGVAQADELVQREAVGRFLDQLTAGQVDLVILLTGVGTRALIAAADELGRRDDLRQGLDRTRVLTRGYKCTAALRTFGRQPDLIPDLPTTTGVAAELDTYRERYGDLRGRRVAVQAYGTPAAELGAALALHGAEVSTIPLYRYRLPDDEAPVMTLLEQLALWKLDAVTFTSPPAVTHLFLLAEAHERADVLRADLNRPGVVVAAVGPSTAAALRDQGVIPEVVADPPRLFTMLELLAARLSAVRSGSV
jgi:uroporphyrinogen-III synthase